MFVVGKRWAFSARYRKPALRLPWEEPRPRPAMKATLIVKGRRTSMGMPRRSGGNGIDRVGGVWEDGSESAGGVKVDIVVDLVGEVQSRRP